MSIRDTIRKHILRESFSESNHDALLQKHGFEFAAQDLDPDDPSHDDSKEDHEQESYWEAFHGDHPATGKTHCVWVYPNHKKAMMWVHSEGDPNEQMGHELSKGLQAAGIAHTVLPEPPQAKQHQGFGLASLAKHLQKHFPIQ